MKKEMLSILALVCILLISGCTSQSQPSTMTNNPDTALSAMPTVSNNASGVQKVEVFHFHGNNQCQGCINVGKCAEDSVNEFFSIEKEAGLVVFAHINGQLPENAELVQRYGATGSSLWIGVYDEDGNFTKEQNTNVWYKTSDMEKCREYIKGVIEEKLKG